MQTYVYLYYMALFLREYYACPFGSWFHFVLLLKSLEKNFKKRGTAHIK